MSKRRIFEILLFISTALVMTVISKSNRKVCLRPVTSLRALSLDNYDYKATNRLPWSGSGYNFWNWKGFKVNYVDLGKEHSDEMEKPTLLLIHGFGASSYHWRFNLPILARNYHVYAIDLLGFGFSDKPVQEYPASVWRDQVLDFIEQVIQRKNVIVAGNSLGGFTALFASASERARQQELISGCILLNAAGRFRTATAADADIEMEDKSFLATLRRFFQRLVITFSFYLTKQPLRIAQILKQVYSVNNSNVDTELVESIRVPSEDPHAAEVFYRIITRNGMGPSIFIDDLLSQLTTPLLLLWGKEVMLKYNN
jgi:pimeloyl-ACP methyl ester carboxylesterase